MSGTGAVPRCTSMSSAVSGTTTGAPLVPAPPLASGAARARPAPASVPHMAVRSADRKARCGAGRYASSSASMTRSASARCVMPIMMSMDGTMEDCAPVSPRSCVPTMPVPSNVTPVLKSGLPRHPKIHGRTYFS